MPIIEVRLCEQCGNWQDKLSPYFNLQFSIRYWSNNTTIEKEILEPTQRDFCSVKCITEFFQAKLEKLKDGIQP